METKFIKTQRVLSPTQIRIADYVINPYRGCSFGCLYCYSQEIKNRKKNPLDLVGVKINAAEVLERELRTKLPKRVLFGSTTECFQSQELKYKISEKILRILNRHKIPYTILTKSCLIERYLPLIARNGKNKIYFTLNLASDKIIRVLEKNSPLLKQRLKTIKEIIAHKIDLRLHLGPFIPYLSDLEKILKIIPKGINPAPNRGGVKEINIELYHHKMGNFKEILNRIEKNISPDLGEKLSQIYVNGLNYQNYAKKLKEKIKNLSKIYQCKFFYIVPDFNEFYAASIDYENALVVP